MRGGGHLILTGGAEGWEAGGWDRAPLAAIAPVRPEPEGATLDPAVTLLVVLDTSGSMARPADLDAAQAASAVAARMTGGRPEGSRIRLAAEGVVQAIERLRSDIDSIGVLGVDTQPRWHLPLQRLGDKPSAQRLARSLASGGGGIYLTTALEAAAPAVIGASSPLRHIILFADAGDVGEQGRAGARSAADIVADLRRRGITVSVVGIGTEGDRDAAYLRRLAEIGGGRATLAEDPRRLPALFARETERLLSGAPPQSLSLPVTMADWSSVLTGITVTTAPPLGGHHRLAVRAGATVHLRSERGPVFAGWRQGAGQVWALSTDLGAATAQPWLRWDGWGRLWANLLQLAQGAGEGGPVDLRLFTDPDAPERVRVQLIERDGSGQSRSPFTRELAVAVLQPGSPPQPLLQPLPLTLTQPGIWEASALLPIDQALRLVPTEADGGPGAAVLAMSPRATPAKTGAWTVDAPPRSGAPWRLQLWPLCAALAACALVGDAWARRRAAP